MNGINILKNQESSYEIYFLHVLCRSSGAHIWYNDPATGCTGGYEYLAPAE